ncbi:DUF3105 domain-containing protein [Leucobacter luti]|uniref:Uncharacterized protein DUF3105 n=1 Tax=Leucobacter luti TaxID=340320 RepID=A0A4R6S4J7_9MICO|nr:DUF3105 domain-containing protein [Leucobacter luti]MCW2286954.1 hypothetical protein [Leucobacter luti]QYM76866.1 DUF3105 domain-containing protein [Leucobacter luti]TCK41181.1 uncharacterized protein DUF3105 [Leucobacter luti]TDP94233.1 uncharacterized protein DUF3105 [Leucobacter luti]
MGDSAGQQTVKQQRADARAKKVERYQQERRAQQRRRKIAIVSGSIGGAAVLALIVTFIATAAEPAQRPQDIAIEGLQEFTNLPATHVGPAPVDYEAEYDMKPPAGGNHFQAWLNCGIYSEPQPNENAVHSLEHGAIWVTYNPDTVTDEQLDELRSAVPDQYAIVSPFPGLETPIAVSAWGAQITMDSPSDARLGQFIDRYWKSASAPEPGASCSGAYEGAGRVV